MAAAAVEVVVVYLVLVVVVVIMVIIVPRTEVVWVVVVHMPGKPIIPQMTRFLTVVPTLGVWSHDGPITSSQLQVAFNDA